MFSVLSNADFLTPEEGAKGTEFNTKKSECLENFVYADYTNVPLIFDFQMLYKQLC